MKRGAASAGLKDDVPDGSGIDIKMELSHVYGMHILKKKLAQIAHFWLDWCFKHFAFTNDDILAEC